jgi:hypothetical protein
LADKTFGEEEIHIKNVKILGSHRKREELSIKSFKLGGGEMQLDPKDTSYVSIYNFDKGQSVTLSPAKKEFFRKPISGSLSDASGLISPIISWPGGREFNAKEATIVWQFRISGAQDGYDLYQLIRQAPADTAKKLPEKIIENKRVVGFEIEQPVKLHDSDAKKGDTAFRKYTWWIDSTTKLPVRLEVHYETTYAHGMVVDFTVSDILFDAQMDESLFNTDPPSDCHEISTRLTLEGYIEMAKQPADEKSNSPQSP